MGVAFNVFNLGGCDSHDGYIPNWTARSKPHNKTCSRNDFPTL